MLVCKHSACINYVQDRIDIEPFYGLQSICYAFGHFRVPDQFKKKKKIATIHRKRKKLRKRGKNHLSNWFVECLREMFACIGMKRCVSLWLWFVIWWIMNDSFKCPETLSISNSSSTVSDANKQKDILFFRFTPSTTHIHSANMQTLPTAHTRNTYYTLRKGMEWKL